MNNNLLLYERLIIESILNRINDDYIREKLIEQYKNLKVKSREYTGAGFYTYFFVKKEVIVNEIEQNAYGGIYADIRNLKNGAGFILWLNDGVIKTLEGYSYNEIWPKKTIVEKLYIINTDGSLTELE